MQKNTADNQQCISTLQLMWSYTPHYSWPTNDRKIMDQLRIKLSLWICNAIFYSKKSLRRHIKPLKLSHWLFKHTLFLDKLSDFRVDGDLKIPCSIPYLSLSETMYFEGVYRDIILHAESLMWWATIDFADLITCKKVFWFPFPHPARFPLIIMISSHWMSCMPLLLSLKCGKEIPEQVGHRKSAGIRSLLSSLTSIKKRIHTVFFQKRMAIWHSWIMPVLL